jgi:hypothetical protein
VLLALTEQCESELVEVLLQSEQVCLQTKQCLAEIGLWRAAGSMEQSLVFLSLRRRHFFGGYAGEVRRIKGGKRTMMESCQLLDLRLAQAFEACIVWVGSELHLGLPEPMA